MQLYRWLFCVLCLAVPCLLQNPVQAEPAVHPIVGTWFVNENTKEYSFSHRFTFKADGTFTAWERTNIGGKESSTSSTGRYKLLGNQLCTEETVEGKIQTETVTWKIIGNSLDLSDGRDNITFARVK